MSKKSNVTNSSKSLLNQCAADAIVSDLNALVKEREDFEQNEFLRSNTRLVALIADTFKKFETASAERGVLIETTKKMKAELEAEGGRVQANTTTVGLFVRYVFRTDRQRSYNYTNVIKAAIQAGKKPEELAQFVADMGGIEECKRQTVKSQKTIEKEQHIAEAMPLVTEYLQSESCIAEFDVAPAYVAKTCGQEFTFLLAKADSNGHVQVVSAVPAFSSSFATWAKQELAVFLAEQQKLADEQAANSSYNRAIKAAAESAKQNNPATETVGELLGA